jgi:hypothetical protein
MSFGIRIYGAHKFVFPIGSFSLLIMDRSREIHFFLLFIYISSTPFWMNGRTQNEYSAISGSPHIKQSLRSAYL